MLEKKGLIVNSDFWFLCLITLLYISFYLPMGSTIPTLLLLAYYFIQTRFHLSFKYSIYVGYTLTFVAFCYLSCLWATNISYTLQYSEHILKSIFGMLVTYVVLYKRKDRVDIMLKAMMWGGYIVMFYSVYSYGISGIIDILSESRRITNEFINANTLAMSLAYTAVIHVYYAVKNKKWTVWHLLLIPALAMLAASGSRKGIIVLTVGVIGIYVLNEYKKPNHKYLFLKILVIPIIGIVGLYCLLQIPMFSFLNMRIGNMIRSFMGATDVDQSLLSRTNFIEVGWNIFLKHPILGVGINNAKLYNYQEVYLHNNFVEMLSNGGIVGFLLYYLLYIYLFWQCFRKRKQIRLIEHMGLCFIILFVMTINHWAYVAYRNSVEYYLLLLITLGIQGTPDGIIRKNIV